MASSGSKSRHLQGHHPDWDPKARGPNGRGTCKWCREEVPEGRRRTWCSQECVDEYSIRSSGAFARRAVWERDQGVCSICSYDTSRLHRILNRMHHPWRSRVSPRIVQVWYMRSKRMIAALRERGYDFGHGVGYDGSYWQADHIQAVVEGGGACGLDNLRTLCTPCHKAETAALRARLAKPRKLEPLKPGSRQLSLF